MRRIDLVKRVAKNTGVIQADVELVLDGVLNEIRALLNEGESLRLNNFGAFKTKIRPEKVARNLKGFATSKPEAMILPSCRVVQFKPCKGFIHAITVK